MKHLFVSYEIAKQLKEKGFDVKCIKYQLVGGINSIINGQDKYMEGDNYNKLETRVSLPLYQQVVDWLDSKNIYITIDIWHRAEGIIYFGYTIGSFERNLIHHDKLKAKTRLEALDVAILEAIKLIKK